MPSHGCMSFPDYPIFARYPDVGVEMLVSERTSNLVEEGIDIAIRNVALTDSSLVAKKIAGDRVTMFITEILRHPGGVAVLAKVTGDYDKTGLPDPLELRFYFTLAGDAIAQLVVIPAKRH